MAQFNSLLVTGESRFINPINGNARNGVYTVIGTQTASTSAWTGKIDVPSLYDGLRIAYYLPYVSTSTAVTLNLTLSTGTTTGAINCYYNSATRLTTHYAVGCVIFFTYYKAGSISVSGTATTDNRWIAHADYNYYTDQNAMYIRYYNNVLAKTAITSNTLIVGDDTGYSTVASGITFNISYPLIWCNTSVASGSSNYANMYSQIYDRSAASIKSGYTSAANKAQYLIVTISGLTATVDSNIITDTLPNTADGKVYIYLGKLGAQSTGANYFLFEPVHPMFEYKNGGLQPYSVGAGTDEHVKQSSSGWSANDYPLLFSNSYLGGTITSSVYKSLQLTYDPSDNQITFKKSDASTGNSPSFRIRDYDGNAIHDYVELGKYTTFREGVQVDFVGANIDVDEDSFISLGGELNLFDGTIDGEGDIDIDGDVTCNNITDYTTNVTKATNDIVTQTGIYTVIGTQTASTNKFTGVLPLSALYDGLTINYYIPYAPTSSNATLNLTLSDGTTTGEKNLYISTSRFTSHIGAGRTAVMTYWSAGSISISGTPTTDDRWVCDGYYDTNDVVTLRSQYPRVTTGVNGLKKNSLFTKTLDGTYTSFFSNTGGTGVNKTYDFTTYYYPRDIWYHQNSSDVAANTVTGNNTIDFQHSLCDLRYSVSGITNSASTSTLVANKPVYIMFDKNSENCGYYRLKDPVWTQTPSDPDAIYTLVAYAYDVYRCDLWVNNPVFTFDGTTLIPFESGYTSTLSQTSFASYNSAVNTNLAECLVTIQTIQNGVSPTPTIPKALIGFDTAEVYVAGTNLWNEKWEVGGIDQTTGLDDSATNRIRSIGFTAVKPDVEYYAYTDGYPCRIFFYDATKTFISDSSVSLNNHVFSTPADCYYIRFITGGSYGTTYQNDLSFNYPSSDTTYHKYVGSVSTTSLGQTIHGAKLNFLTGEMTITHGIADIGDLSVGYNATEAIFYVTINGKENTEKNYVKCSCFTASNQVANGLADAKSKLTANKSCISSYTTTNPRVYIRWDECTDTTTFTSTLTGQKIVYELATPITVQLSPNTVKQILSTNYVYANCGDIEIAYINRTIPAEAITNNSLLNLSDTSISDVQPCDILTYDGYNWRNTNNIALKDTNRHTTINLNGDTGLITSENSPSSGGQIVTDVAIGGFTTGSGNYFKFSLPFSNTATSAAIISLDQSNSKLMLPSTVLQTNFIDLSNSTVSSITKDWITFEFKLNSTQSANMPGTIALVNFKFELY